ncbi:MAG TPA: flavodoxin family protein [Clostridia bacterium]|nr:flavodoxin family protein [Clostridia bacterium]
MTYAVVYSSRTGNTRAVAQAVAASLPGCLLLPVEDSAAALACDVLFVGGWIDRGTFDEKTRAFLEALSGKRVALFLTLGAYPFSKHALETQLKVWNLAAEQNEVLGCFACQGKLSPVLHDKFKSLPPGHPHALTPQRLQRYEEAAGRPNPADLQNAMDYARTIAQRVAPYAAG